MTIKEVCEELGVTLSAVSLSIRQKKLNPTQIGNKWYFTKEELERYKAKRYKRTESRHPNGEMIYDKSKNYYSVPEVAKMFSVPVLRVYRLIRNKKLNSFRVASAHVVIIEDKSAWEPIISLQNKLN